MLRRALLGGALLAGALAGLGLGTARGDEDMRVASQFLQGLKDRGYYDLAADFLEKLRAEPDTPADLKNTIDYEQGRIMLEEASKSGDLVRRKELLDQARGKIASFVEKYPKHPRVPEASVQLARLLVERGHLAMLTAGELDDKKEKAEKDAKLAEARASFDQARTAYATAEKQLEAKFKTFPPFIPEGDPRRNDRDQTHASLMDAQLQQAVVDYEQGQTYPENSKERKEFLAKGLAQFEELYKKYRTQWAGLTARMFQAKCYEESGDPADLGKALGIYKELLEHTDPRLRPLQRHVGYFKIIAERKREQYALAADDCMRWLSRYNTTAERHSAQGLGVYLELAKNILAQLPTALNEAEKKAAIDRSVEALKEVVRYPSIYKPEALALLQKYKPKAVSDLNAVARLTYDDAMAQAEQAIGQKEYDAAVALTQQAIRQAARSKDMDKLNNARYYLAFCYYMSKQYYSAAVVADFLARHYPRFGLAPKATELAMAALADAYNTYTDLDRVSDLNNLVDEAKYTADTFPDTDQGDTARMILGQISHGTGRYPEAVQAFESVRQKSGKWVDARTKAGASHWEQSNALRRKGGPDAETQADAEVKVALERLDEALKARQEAGTATTDAGLVNNVCDIAEIYLDTGRPDDALKRLAPLAQGQAPGNTAPYKRLMADLLRAHIGVNQVDQAIKDMAALEKAGGEGQGLTQLYFGLGKLLEKEMDALKTKGDSAGLARTQQAYLQFLTALANSKSGQTYESLEWAGESMLKLDRPKEAGDVLQRILDNQGKDEAFRLKNPEKLLRTRLKYAAALRGQKRWAEADTLVKQLNDENPRSIEARTELAMLKEGKAEAKAATWKEAYAQWKFLGDQLRVLRSRPPEYYDAMWHSAYCLYRAGDSLLALQTLKGITRLSPSLGKNPDMQKKYQQLIDQIQRGPKHLSTSR